MANAMKIREHMRVLGSDGEPVGTVDHLEGDKIKLTRTDSMAAGKHHWLPTSWVENVDEDEDEVLLGLPAADAMRQWDAQSPTDARL